MKICKFLCPYDCLVSADLDGFIHFWAITPSPRKNDHLCKVKDDNVSEHGMKIVNFPIRAMDFSSADNILFTGDEMGYMVKWDLSVLLAKLEEVKKRETKVTYKSDLFAEDPDKLKERDIGSTFVTGLDAGGSKQRIEFNETDVVFL